MDSQHTSSGDQSRHPMIASGGASDKGPTRSENQDAFWIPTGEPDAGKIQLFLVADGVGGQENGADAAQIAIETARTVFFEEKEANTPSQEALETALQSANLAVFEESQRREVRRMGATFVAAFIEDDQLLIAHVGDARAYLVRNDEMRRLTRDDTWVQRQLEEGWITEEQAAKHEYRNVVTQVLGNKLDVNVHLSQRHPIQQGDALLLCSDGLYDVLSETQMLPIFKSLAPQEAAQRLIDDAILGQASDNITAVVIKIQSSPLQPGLAVAAPLEIDQPTIALSTADQPTTPITLADQPTVPPLEKVVPPPPVKEKSKAPNWLIILAISAVLLIAAALLFFWMQNRNLESAVESAAEEEMTAVIQEVMSPTDPSSALRPAPERTNEAIVATELPATEPAPPSPTLSASPTIELTPVPRGCVNEEIAGFVWDRLQLETGNCENTQVLLDIGQEVLILEETIIIGEGSCGGDPFIRIQAADDAELEGWILQSAVDRVDPGQSCGP